jgi:hypothetical protein
MRDQQVEGMGVCSPEMIARTLHVPGVPIMGVCDDAGKMRMVKDEGYNIALAYAA